MCTHVLHVRNVLEFGFHLVPWKVSVVHIDTSCSEGIVWNFVAFACFASIVVCSVVCIVVGVIVIFTVIFTVLGNDHVEVTTVPRTQRSLLVVLEVLQKQDEWRLADVGGLEERGPLRAGHGAACDGEDLVQLSLGIGVCVFVTDEVREIGLQLAPELACWGVRDHRLKERALADCGGLVRHRGLEGLDLVQSRGPAAHTHGVVCVLLRVLRSRLPARARDIAVLGGLVGLLVLALALAALAFLRAVGLDLEGVEVHAAASVVRRARGILFFGLEYDVTCCSEAGQNLYSSSSSPASSRIVCNVNPNSSKTWLCVS